MHQLRNIAFWLLAAQCWFMFYVWTIHRYTVTQYKKYGGWKPE